MEKIKALAKGSKKQNLIDSDAEVVNLESSFYHKLHIAAERNSRIRLDIPETIIYGFGFDSPWLIYTDSNGYVKTKSSISSRYMFQFFEICWNKRGT